MESGGVVTVKLKISLSEGLAENESQKEVFRAGGGRGGTSSPTIFPSVQTCSHLVYAGDSHQDLCWGGAGRRVCGLAEGRIRGAVWLEQPESLQT